MRDRFPLLVFAAIIFVSTTGYLFIQSARRGSFSEPLSTYRSQAQGARGLYLLAQKNGIHVARRHSDLRDLADISSRTLVLLGVSSIPEEELTSLVQFVRQGGSLIFVGNGRSSDRISSNTEEKFASFQYYSQEHYIWPSFDVEWISSESSSLLRQWVPALPSRYTERVTTVETPSAGFYVRSKGEPWLPLLVDAENSYLPGAIYFTFGKGKAVFISSPSLASNEYLTLADNAQFWMNLLRTSASNNHGWLVEFDEFHHGFTGERSISEYAARHGLHWAALQVFLAFLLWIAASKYIGIKKNSANEERSSKADYLFTMANILKKSGQRSYVARMLFQGLMNSMRSLTRVGPKASSQEIGKALESQGQAQLARALLQTEEKRLTAIQSEEKLLAFGQKCAETKKRATRRKL